jgi:hypothetical protein
MFKKKFFKKMRNLMLILNLLEKLQYNSCGKSFQLKSERKIEFLTTITECKSFRPIILCVNFLPLFFNGFKLSIAFCVTHSGFFRTNFFAFITIFAKFKGKSGRNGSKIRKLFYKCVLESRSGRFCQKKSKSLYPTGHKPDSKRCVMTVIQLLYLKSFNCCTWVAHKG